MDVVFRVSASAKKVSQEKIAPSTSARISATSTETVKTANASAIKDGKVQDVAAQQGAVHTVNANWASASATKGGLVQAARVVRAPASAMLTVSASLTELANALQDLRDQIAPSRRARRIVLVMGNATWKRTSVSATSVTRVLIVLEAVSARATVATMEFAKLESAFVEKVGKGIHARSSPALRDALATENVFWVSVSVTKVTEDPSAACVMWFMDRATLSPKIADARLCVQRKLVLKARCGQVFHVIRSHAKMIAAGTVRVPIRGFASASRCGRVNLVPNPVARITAMVMEDATKAPVFAVMVLLDPSVLRRLARRVAQATANATRNLSLANAKRVGRAKNVVKLIARADAATTELAFAVQMVQPPASARLDTSGRNALYHAKIRRAVAMVIVS